MSYTVNCYYIFSLIWFLKHKKVQIHSFIFVEFSKYLYLNYFFGLDKILLVTKEPIFLSIWLFILIVEIHLLFIPIKVHVIHERLPPNCRLIYVDYNVRWRWYWGFDIKVFCWDNMIFLNWKVWFITDFGHIEI